MTGWRLGVDYGTSHTVAVLGRPDGHTRPLLFDASPLLPSAVFADPATGLLVGREALVGAQRDPGRFEPYPKRQIDAGHVLLGDQQVPVVDLVAAVLRRVADEAVRVAGTAPAEVVLTHPAGWGPTRRAVLSSAAQAVGWPAPVMLAEPVAAGLFLDVAGHAIPQGAPLVVYDLGAGTLDVSVLRRTAGGFEIVAADGLADLGGVDLDALVVGLVGEVVSTRDPRAWSRLTSPADPADQRRFRALWDAARLARESLSRHAVAPVAVPIAELEVPVTREEFERAAAPLLALTTDLTQTMLRRANLTAAELAGIFLVGGATRTPLVATALHRAIGRPPTVSEQPETVVADGALRAPSGARPGPAPTAGPPPGQPPPGPGAGPPPPRPGSGPPAGPVHPGLPGPAPVPARRPAGGLRALVAVLTAAGLLLAAGIATVVVLVVRARTDSALEPVAGTWQIASLSAGWANTSRSATMRISTDGTVRISDPESNQGCTGTITSAGAQRPYRLRLNAGCDTAHAYSGPQMTVTVSSTGDRLSVISNADGPDRFNTSTWTRVR